MLLWRKLRKNRQTGRGETACRECVRRPERGGSLVAISATVNVCDETLQTTYFWFNGFCEAIGSDERLAGAVFGVVLRSAGDRLPVGIAARLETGAIVRSN